MIINLKLSTVHKGMHNVRQSFGIGDGGWRWYRRDAGLPGFSQCRLFRPSGRKGAGHRRHHGADRQDLSHQ
jgi:hypothetical protein